MQHRSVAPALAALVLACAVVASPEGDSTGNDLKPGPPPPPSPSGSKDLKPRPTNTDGPMEPAELESMKPEPKPTSTNGPQPPSGPMKPKPKPTSSKLEQLPSIIISELLEASQINVTTVTVSDLLEAPQINETAMPVSELLEAKKINVTAVTATLQGYITDALTAVDGAVRNAFQRSLNLVLRAAKYFVELAKSSLSALGLGSVAGGVIDGPAQGRSSSETEAHVAELARRLDTRALYRKVARLASESGASRRAAIALRKLSAFLGASTSA